MAFEMERVHKSGLTVPNILVTGLMIKLMAMVNYIMQMVTYTKENGQMIKPMAGACILTPMELNIMENGRMINNMVKVQNLGLMVQYMKENTTKVKRTAEEN